MERNLSPRRRAYDLAMRALVWLSALLTCALLVFLIGYIFYRGAGSVTWDFLSGTSSYIKDTIGILPKHLFAGKDINTAPANQHPVGTGRYKFVEWDTAGGMIILEKNKDYYGKVPNIDRIVYKTVAVESTKALMLQSGEADLAWLNAKYADTFRGKDGYKNIDFATADYRSAAMDFHTDFWKRNGDSIGVLNYALNKDAIAKSVLNGQGFPAFSPIQMNAYGGNKAADIYPYDLKKFAAEMEKLGWKKGKDGIYERNGQKFSFTIQVRDYEEERVDIAKVIAEQDPADVDALMNCKYPGTELTVSETMPEKVMSIGENLQIRRFVRFSENTSVGYVHAGGKIGVLVNLAVDGGIDATEIGKNVAMQIAALNPRFWDKSQVTDEVLAEEKKIALALMDTDPKMASKPEAVKEKIVMGKMNKFYEENCLLQMEFVRGDIFQGSVEKYIADAAKKLGGSVKFVDAVRFQTGEGIEKKQEDFAAEVAAQMNMGK